MNRAFNTHNIRKQTELSGRLWDFYIPEAGSEQPTSGQMSPAKVWVPSCWETYPGLEKYRGIGIYETTFEAEGNIRLEFKGVSHFAKVYVDGIFLGDHYGSYTPFSVYALGLEKGVHQLRVEGDNRFDKKYALDIPNDYESYGGISRGVVLENASDVLISWVHVTPLSEKDGVWDVKVEVCCRNLTAHPYPAELELTVAGKHIRAGEVLIQPGEQVVYAETLQIADVEAWSMEHPKLYEVSAVLAKDGQPLDDLIDRFGFRLVRVEGRKILLNGRPIQIKGFCRHEDHPQYGCALPPAVIMSDLQLIKDMGGNSIRTAHYPNDEWMLDFCDEMGILVWEENHARALSEEEMKNPYFEVQCEQCIREMIAAHYNHPSIYIWGILNECASETAYGRTCYQAQLELIKELDSSRPHSFSSCKYGEDLCQDLPDVCAWNMYPYWYEDDTAAERVTNLLQWIATEGKAPGKPLLVTEIGAGAIYGFRSRGKDVWSEELQSEILGKQLREVASIADCAGSYVWQFCDVRVSKEWAMRRPKSRNNKGIVDEYRRPKLAYDAVKEVYRALPDYKE